MVRTVETPIRSISYPSAARSGSQLKNQSAIELVHTTQQGILEAFNTLVTDYQDLVYNHAYWLLGDAAAAEDAAQEAFYRAYRAIRSFDGPSFRAWILRITTNYCLDQIRRYKRHPMIPIESPDIDNDEEWNENSEWLVASELSPEQILEQADLFALIHHCLLTLSPNDRLAIILVDVQEMNYQEAAGILHIPMGSFKSRLCRARAKLMEAINQIPGSDTLLQLN
jgi:RNA polymerase sigma-70 factor, ECF subfamily